MSPAFLDSFIYEISKDRTAERSGTERLVSSPIGDLR